MEEFPDYSPEYDGNQRSLTPRIVKSSLGDGYSQRAADGLNTLDESGSYTFFLPDADIDDIEEFLVARGGWEAFTWTAPRDTVEKVWICPKWSRTFMSAGYSKLSVTFERVWDL